MKLFNIAYFISLFRFLNSKSINIDDNNTKRNEKRFEPIIAVEIVDHVVTDIIKKNGLNIKHAKKRGSCSNSNTGCQINTKKALREYFIIGNNKAQCTIRELTAGSNDLYSTEVLNVGNNRKVWNNFIIDMNGHLDCGCFDKYNDWKDIKYVQYAHVYGAQENGNSVALKSAFTQIEKNLKNTKINRNNGTGFSYDYGNGDMDKCYTGKCPFDDREKASNRKSYWNRCKNYLANSLEKYYGCNNIYISKGEEEWK